MINDDSKPHTTTSGEKTNTIHHDNDDDDNGNTTITPDDIETGPSLVDDNDENDDDEEHDGQLKLNNGRLVPNCCAICLTGYHVGDVVIWSSNKDCAHAFHQDCVVGWLVKMQPETPCPCCRQEFTDLEHVRKEAKITWDRHHAFNLNAISL